MPSVISGRVKTDGTGEIYYVQDTFVSTSNAVNIAPSSDTNSGFYIRGVNIGYGHGIYAGFNGTQQNGSLEFKSLVAGDGIQITHTDSVITITSTVEGGNGTVVANGMVLPLGNTVFDQGAVQLSDSMMTTIAINELNKILGRLVPSGPPMFPNGALSVINTSGNTPLLALGVTNNAGSGAPVAGGSVTRVAGLAVNSNNFNDIGPSDSGIVSLMLNDNPASVVTLDGNPITQSGLVINDIKDYPVSAPGFWKSMDVSVVGRVVLDGVNSIRLTHSGAGNTNKVFFVSDSMTQTPTLSATSIALAAIGTVAYSSSVPHFNTGGQLLAQASMTNISGNTYYGGSDPMTISGTNSVVSAQTYNFQTLGVSTPVPLNTTMATPLNSMLIDINGTNVHNVGTIQGVARNVNGQSGATTLANTRILVKRGSAGSRIDEMSIPVVGLGSLPNANNAVRINIPSGVDNPTDAHSPWSSTATLSAYDAAVVAGILGHDVTDYSSGYLPAGPNLSIGRAGSQYATFVFNRSVVSQFKIVVTGNYAGCWIKLPNISDNGAISPNAKNGWWDAYVPYNGAGVPGNASDPSAGCSVGSVMNGGSGTFTVTFGPQSSTNATDNMIIVRLKMIAGQKITSLRFTN